MSGFWKRILPHKSTLTAAVLATLLTALGLLIVWTDTEEQEADMTRYGEAISQTLAQASSGLLLHRDQIELAVIASYATRQEEISGVVFYGVNQDIIAMSGSSDLSDHFTAPATLDDTITGYASVALNEAAFIAPTRFGNWLASLLIVIGAPMLTLFALQLSRRGNRSLPIVSVPPPQSHTPQDCFCLFVNLHNQFALHKAQRQQAIQDALTMAREVCAIHQGIAADLAERGVVMLFDKQAVTPTQAICASFLIQHLLRDFETEGHFRVYLTQTRAPGSPGEISSFDPQELREFLTLDDCLLLAALAKPGTVLIAHTVFSALGEAEQDWATPFSHPLTDDIEDSDSLYIVSTLPEQMTILVENQAELILGFNKSTG